ncbi:metallophosphoesterase [Microbacterium mitrae]|uniref:Metallophosphoesterase n=1 Tax=Microbacterium mitrae TaxID=664640 RepID=A0A5C8HKD0_9MICO|nr:metallophosphoesterase [Microbacterium mitrae]TXK03058.1 metallophosphoesterase [Microbacterium mitrae]
MSSARHTARRLVTAAGIAGAAAATWGFGIERHLYTLRQHTVAILPPRTDPIRILHLSDVHMAPWQGRKQAWLASLASLRPDLVINTGDNLGHEDALRGIKAAFAGLAGVPGLYVHGSNDLVAPRPRNWLRYFAGPSEPSGGSVELLDTGALDEYFTEVLGWRPLNNAATTLEVRGHRVGAYGVDDPHVGRDRMDMVPELAASVADADLKLGVAHAPYRRVLDGLMAGGADALFAGHTHGGQVRVPGFGALVANCDIPLHQARGLSTWHDNSRAIPLNVSAGVGHSIYAPVRFACRPEASLITLVPRSA